MHRNRPKQRLLGIILMALGILFFLSCTGESGFSQSRRSDSGTSDERESSELRAKSLRSPSKLDRTWPSSSQVPVLNSPQPPQEQTEDEADHSEPDTGLGNKNEEDVDPDNKASKPRTDSDFNAWCEKAIQTKIMTGSATISALLDEFCDASVAKPLLTNTLLEKAHTIGGDVQITYIRDVASNTNRTTSARFGYAFKMPTDIKDYFDRARVNSTKLEQIKEAAEGPGGTAKIEILQTFEKDGPHHIRGVLSHQIIDKNASGRRVIVDYDFRADDHVFEDGWSYMITGTVANAYQTMKKNDTLAALVKFQGQSYMVVVVEIAVYNRGYPGIAEPNLRKNIQAGSNALWQRLLKQSKP